MDRETCQLTSLRLSRVLEDIGVSEWMITKRRKMWLMAETLCDTAFCNILGVDAFFHHFGSQSEGSTTPGMTSDVDMLAYTDECCVLQDLRGWQPQKINLLVFKNERIPPQHCYIQVLRQDIPLPLTSICGSDIPLPMTYLSSFERDNEGRLFLKNTYMDSTWTTLFKAYGKLIIHGPSRSANEMQDYVAALRCATLTEECQFMFSRPRPGHWPKPETLTKARMCPSFLVPQGYPESENKKIEWRFSTSLMERLLVFDFTPTQMKVYTLIKMIRKTFIKPIVGDRLSTFHLKTAMMFTIESYPPEMWREDQIIQCAIYCLTTLCRWLKLGYCPHFTTSGVNLFVGKLNKDERRNLLETFQDYIDESLQIVFSIEMDDLGSRLINILDSTQTLTMMTRNQMLNSVWKQLVENCYVRRGDVLTSMVIHQNLAACISSFLINILTKLTAPLDLTETDNGIQQWTKSLPIPFLAGTLASTLASECIRLSRPLSTDIVNLYEISIDSDLLSSRLKFASMLYCTGQYVSAAQIMSYCESLLGSYVIHLCTCKAMFTSLSDEFADKTINMDISDIFRSTFVHCVTFTIHERFCVPEHLLCEISRTMDTDENAQRTLGHMWMETIAIDSLPFLYYLQYLTYKQLNQAERKRVALQKLTCHLFHPSYQCSGHRETYLNILAHCYELEKKPNSAKCVYSMSLYIQPRNNAASWHMRRLSQSAIN